MGSLTYSVAAVTYATASFLSFNLEQQCLDVKIEPDKAFRSCVMFSYFDEIIFPPQTFSSHWILVLIFSYFHHPDFLFSYKLADLDLQLLTGLLQSVSQ